MPEQPNEPRNRRAARRALILVERAANDVFEQRLQTVMSQAQWNDLATAVARAAAVHIDADFDFSKTVTEGDVADPKGRINAKAVLDCLRGMADNARKEGAQQRLLYLAQHFENTMKELNVLKELPHGKATQEA